MDPQLTLALPDLRRGRRGTWPDTLFYASGTNDAGEIRGFAALGIPVGFCAAEVGPSGLAELDRLHGTGMPLFGDTGAYGEVSADPVRQAAAGAPPAPGKLAVVRPITAEEWERRLAVYDRVAARFGERFDAVAPDRVGDQEETLERLLAFRFCIRALAARGARILLPLHGGPQPLPAFHAEARRALGVDLVPAFPMPKGGTTARDVLATAAALSPFQTRRWRRDPDAFLQEPVSAGSDSPCWWEHPALRQALDEAWCQHLHRLHTAPRKERAIRIAFRHHPAAGQFAPPAARPPAA